MYIYIYQYSGGVSEYVPAIFPGFPWASLLNLLQVSTCSSPDLTSSNHVNHVAIQLGGSSPESGISIYMSHGKNG